MRSKVFIGKGLGAAVLVAVLASSASAATINIDTTWANRTGILGQTGGFVDNQRRHADCHRKGGSRWWYW